MELSLLLSAPMAGFAPYPTSSVFATNGPVFNSLPSSFCTEAYGRLSYLCILYHVSQHTHSPLPTETLIAKISEIEKWPYFPPNATMDPDWDVLQQIITSRRLFPSLPVLQFVKGHQDVDYPYVTLPLPAQLNVDADHLASSYAPHPTENPSIVPMIAGTAASLHLPSGTITTKHRSALHRAASTDTIQHYIQNKPKMTNAEFASIKWIAHSRSVHRFYHKKQFIVKLVHEWLLLGRLTSKYKQHHMSKCPSCSHEIKNGDHFLQCPVGPQWKPEMLRALCNYFDQTPTGPFLGNLLITGLSKWLHNEPAIFSDFPALSTASFSTRRESVGISCSSAGLS